MDGFGEMGTPSRFKPDYIDEKNVQLQLLFSPSLSSFFQTHRQLWFGQQWFQLTKTLCSQSLLPFIAHFTHDETGQFKNKEVNKYLRDSIIGKNSPGLVGALKKNFFPFIGSWIAVFCNLFVLAWVFIISFLISTSHVTIIILVLYWQGHQRS